MHGGVDAVMWLPTARLFANVGQLLVTGCCLSWYEQPLGIGPNLSSCMGTAADCASCCGCTICIRSCCMQGTC